MARKGVILSEKCGLNPSFTCCEICGKDIGIALFGRIKTKDNDDVKAPMKVANGICEDCQKVINEQNGVFIIEVKDGETGDNPYRTGRIVAINRIAMNELFEDFTGNAAYMEESTFSELFKDVEFNNKEE